MQFCPKCGSIMMPKKEDGKVLVKCKCGYSAAAGNTKQSESVNKTTKIEIIDEANQVEHHPLTDEECPKCKHNKAHYMLVQTRAADEAPTKFLKCEKCKHTWRDYT